MKKLIAVVFVALAMIATPAFAGYLAGDKCIKMVEAYSVDEYAHDHGVSVTDAIAVLHSICPDRSFGWQEREHSGILAPEAGSAGSAGGDAGGASSGGDSSTQ